MEGSLRQRHVKRNGDGIAQEIRSAKTSMTRTELTKEEKDEWDRASAFIDAGEYLTAKRVLDELLRNPRSTAKLYAHRGYVEYRIEEFAEAIADFSTALTLSPGGQNTLFLRGRCYEEIEDFSSAILDYVQVIEINPNTADAHAHMGFCLEQLGLHGEALTAYRLALSIDPQETLALAGLDALGARTNRTVD